MNQLERVGNEISGLRHWLVMIVLSFSGGIIFMLPFLREVYYIPMQTALGLTNTELGMLMSVFGVTSLISYFPGGWLADRYSARKLISTGLLCTGIAGLYFAKFPSYAIALVIHAFWGVSITLVFWGAMIKATRNWASRDSQGKAFGILETGRGVAEVLSSALFLAVFAWLGSGDTALAAVVVAFALTNIALGMSAWLIIDDNPAGDGEARPRVGLHDIVSVLRKPAVWLISIVILTAYSAYWGSFYFTPYATDVFLLSVTAGGAISVGRMWLKPAASLAAGFFGDRVGIARSIAGFFLVTAASFFVFALTPASPELLPLVFVNITISALAIFAIRGIYFALLEEGGIPIALTGTATGIVSAIGFVPDIYMPLIGGALLDAYPGVSGYRYLFAVVAGFCVIGMLAALLIVRLRARLAQRQ